MPTRRAPPARSSCAARRCRSSVEYRKGRVGASLASGHALGGRPYVDLPLPQSMSVFHPRFMSAQPTVVVLAAGRSSRFGAGHHKLAQPLGDSTVLARTLASAIASHLRTVVVTTAAFLEVARSSVAARDVIVLPEVGSDGANLLGMGVSIAAGVGASPDSSGWLVLPGDMPLIQPATLLAVARALDEHAVAYAQYRSRRGHPVGFAAELYPELTALVGDEG